MVSASALAHHGRDQYINQLALTQRQAENQARLSGLGQSSLLNGYPPRQPSATEQMQADVDEWLKDWDK